MGWKNLSTWLKFGIVFVIIDIILTIILISLGFLTGKIEYFMYSVIIQGIGFVVITPLMKNYPLFSILGYIIGIIMWFLIGAAIGSIIGKIKSKKQGVIRR
jgi:hypothetical protein